MSRQSINKNSLCARGVRSKVATTLMAAGCYAIMASVGITTQAAASAGTANTQSTTNMLGVQLGILESAQYRCKHHLGDAYGVMELCTKVQQNLETCQGDSGGPIVVSEQGVVSAGWGLGCGSGVRGQ